jgi:SanA protein
MEMSGLIEVNLGEEMTLILINHARVIIKHYRKALLLIAGGGLSLVAFLCLWPWWINGYYKRFVYLPDNAPPVRVAIVFGARIYPDGRLSAMLQDRVETAVQLYQAGKVQKLLLSGDNRFVDYNEPKRMMDYVLNRGVPAEDIQLDYAGRRTYDTCYRAKAIFQLQSAVLVTQDFHLPRALFTCRSLGIEAVGVRADLRSYRRLSIGWSKIREFPATIIALFDVIRRQPASVLGDPIPI